jgi:asparaginyl-tRNA synthetase
MPSLAHLSIKALLAGGKPGERHQVRGWVRSRRDSKNLSFVVVSDGSSQETLQVVLDHGVAGAEAVLGRLTTGASVVAEGELVASPGAGQPIELRAQELHVVGDADAETYPLQKKGHSWEFLRGIAHLRPRTNSFGAVFRIRSVLAQEVHRFFADRGFAYVHTPIITASDCEGAGEMFEVRAGKEDFFGRPAMLTVSGQLNAEAMAYGLGLVYTFGPTFRAENSNTARHLSEFWMIEPEMAFWDLEDDMTLAEAFVKACIDAVFERCRPDLELLNKFVDKTLIQTLDATRRASFVRVPYSQAIELLQASGRAFEYPVAWGNDIQTEHERYLAEEHFKGPLIVYDYPRALKAFYMYQNQDGRTVRAMDLLVPRIGELIGGSQREHRLDRLEPRILELGARLEDYAWYLDLHRYGAVPHAGFGLGFERLVMFCTGMTNIRDVIPFPRSPGQAAF